MTGNARPASKSATGLTRLMPSAPAVRIIRSSSSSKGTSVLERVLPMP